MESVPLFSSGSPYKYIATERTRHGTLVRYLRRPRRRKIRLYEEPGTEAFRAEYITAWNDRTPVKRAPPKANRKAIIQGHISRDVERAIKSAKSRAKAKGLVFSLSGPHLQRKLSAQRYKCAVTGVKFEPRQTGGYPNNRNPWSVSIDRIDPAAGYVDGNVRLITLALNTALSNWGEDVFARLATAYLTPA